MTKTRKVFCAVGRNVGDALSPVLLSGLYMERFRRVDCGHGWLCSGSVLHHAEDNNVVVGTGSFSGLGTNAKGLSVKCVRGPATAKLLGRRDIPFCDAGLLMPFVIQPSRTKKTHEYGIVPHYVDMNSFTPPDNAVVISPFLPILDFVKNIQSCSVILSSSLHGLILAEAYGIPAIRIKLQNTHTIRDFDYKHADYYEGTARELPVAVSLAGGMCVEPPRIPASAMKTAGVVHSEIVRGRNEDLRIHV